MSKKLQSKDALYLGSMLFGMLFGAGNLIFPVHLGQESGAQVGPAVVGLLISAIGLPFLTILAMGMSKSKSVTELASPALSGNWSFICGATLGKYILYYWGSPFYRVESPGTWASNLFPHLLPSSGLSILESR